MSGNLVIYGAGGHGKVIADAAGLSGWTLFGFVDSKLEVGSVVSGLPVISNSFVSLLERLPGIDFSVVVAIGDNKTRKEKIERAGKLGIPIATVMHPSSVVNKGSTVKEGTVVFAGAVVNVGSTIGVGVIINTGATVDHDSFIGDFSHISPGAHLGGNVSVREGAHISIGCSIRDKISIGEWSVVGVGSVVVKDVPDGVVTFGAPAKIYKEL